MCAAAWLSGSPPHAPPPPPPSLPHPRRRPSSSLGPSGLITEMSKPRGRSQKNGEGEKGWRLHHHRHHHAHENNQPVSSFAPPGISIVPRAPRPPHSLEPRYGTRLRLWRFVYYPTMASLRLPCRDASKPVEETTSMIRRARQGCVLPERCNSYIQEMTLNLVCA